MFVPQDNSLHLLIPILAVYLHLSFLPHFKKCDHFISAKHVACPPSAQCLRKKSPPSFVLWLCSIYLGISYHALIFNILGSEVLVRNTAVWNSMKLYLPYTITTLLMVVLTTCEGK